MERSLVWWFVAASLCLGCSVAAAQNAPNKPAPAKAAILVELNKLESSPNACRGYFVINNGVGEPLRELRLDVFLFDKGGVILRRVGLTFADIRAERSKVVLFDIPDTACDAVGRLVVNDVL